MRPRLIKMKRIFLFWVIFIAFSWSAFGSGTCNLDKKTYNYAENAVFECKCTVGNEVNIDGYMVFLKSDGTVLYSEPKAPV